MGERNTLLFGGYAQFPEGTAIRSLTQFFGVGFEVDPETWIIKDVSSTFFTTLSKRFLASIFVGRNISEGGLAEGIKEFQERYFCKGKMTIIAAIYEAEKSYCQRTVKMSPPGCENGTVKMSPSKMDFRLNIHRKWREFC